MRPRPRLLDDYDSCRDIDFMTRSIALPGGGSLGAGLRDRERRPSRPRPAQTRLALTFDDLPVAGTRNPDEDQCLSTPDIRAINEAMVSTLARHHAPAIGFVNERGISEAPAVEERRAILRIQTRGVRLQQGDGSWII